MDELLPHYERELAFLRNRSGDFARRYPKIAGRLQVSGDVGDDPHVERLMESFALLASRIHKRLDDDFPLFTESLLEVLYPHYLRPFPSCSVVAFDLGSAAAQMSQAVVVERGCALHSRPVKGVTCKFRTTQDVRLVPIKLTEVSYRNAIAAPSGGCALPASATSVLSLSLTRTSSQMSWRQLLACALTVYLDGEASQVSVLREAICHHAQAVMVQMGANQPWRQVFDGANGAAKPMLQGFDADQALVDWDARSNVAYRLLAEYFAFPEKFNFVSLPAILGLMPDETEVDTITLHLPMRGIRADSDPSRLLETISASNFVLGATPVVNLFRQAADPIRLTHRTASYPLVVDGRKAFGYEVYALDKVFRVRQSSAGETVDEVRPFFSLHHDDLTGEGEHGEDVLPGHLGYWQLSRDEDLAQVSPGYEMSLTFVDGRFEPMTPSVDTLSLDVTATNRDLPSLLSPGTAGGDLFVEGGGPAREIKLLRKPTSTMRVERGRGVLWRLISHLSLNHLSLSGAGLDAIKEMLRLYDWPRSAANQRQINGLVAIDFKPASAWLPGQPFATLVRGTEIRLTVDEESFVGTGLGLFAAVLDRYFGMYVHANSFTRLTVVSARTQEEVVTCQPRNGDITLL
ncbi:type VI secretion system baseplate subunit TssF [Aquabacterium sp.]|uniref:type VI secretion system baseplate subunit TssF n=1 Tax=Aquabacterium sp. TaxID=1872578 RepID=UPI0035B150BA